MEDKITLEEKIKTYKTLSRDEVNRMIDAGKTHGGTPIYVHRTSLVLLEYMKKTDEYKIKSYWEYQNKK